jgi:flagellar biosynthesis chaperone FliJ
MTDDLIARLDAAIGGPDRRTKDGRVRKLTPMKIETQLLVDARAEVVRVRDLCETIEGQVRTIWEQREEIERLKDDLQRATSMPMATEAARNVALERKVDQQKAEIEQLRKVIAIWERRI